MTMTMTATQSLRLPGEHTVHFDPHEDYCPDVSEYDGPTPFGAELRTWDDLERAHGLARRLLDARRARERRHIVAMCEAAKAEDTPTMLAEARRVAGLKEAVGYAQELHAELALYMGHYTGACDCAEWELDNRRDALGWMVEGLEMDTAGHGVWLERYTQRVVEPGGLPAKELQDELETYDIWHAHWDGQFTLTIEAEADGIRRVFRTSWQFVPRADVELVYAADDAGCLSALLDAAHEYGDDPSWPAVLSVLRALLGDVPAGEPAPAGVLDVALALATA